MLFGVMLALLMAWEGFAQSRASDFVPIGTADHLVFDNTKTEQLSAALAATPRRRSPEELRILMLGCSQLRLVPGNENLLAEGPSEGSLPIRLARDFGSLLPNSLVVDLSTPGQHLTESALIGGLVVPVLEPDLVLLDVAVFAAQRPGLRALLAEDILAAPHLRGPMGPLEQLPGAFRDALSRAQEGPPSGPVSETIQDQLDGAIAASLQDTFASIRLRADLYKQLIQVPLQRDLIEGARELFDRRRRSKRYRLSKDLDSIMEALGWGLDRMRSAGARVHLVAFPYDKAAPRPPYSAEEHARLLEATRELAGRHGATFLDLSGLLPSSDYRHGDGLHYRASGHATLANALLCALTEGGTVLGRALAGPPPICRAAPDRGGARALQ